MAREAPAPRRRDSSAGDAFWILTGTRLGKHSRSSQNGTSFSISARHKMADIRSEYTDSINFFAGHSPRSLAAKYGTPLYVYSEAILRQRCREVMSGRNCCRRPAR